MGPATSFLYMMTLPRAPIALTPRCKGITAPFLAHDHDFIIIVIIIFFFLNKLTNEISVGHVFYFLEIGNSVQEKLL